MDPYPHDIIHISGRPVSITSIVEKSVIPESEYDVALFSFIQAWFHGSKAFNLTTSGSTGEPKPITIKRDQMIASARLTERALNLKPSFHSLLCLHPKYIAGQMMLVRSFVTGMRLNVVPPVSNPLALLEGQKVDFTAMVPAQVFDVIRSPFAASLNDIDTLLIGGGSLDEESLALLQNTSCKCYATYGMTETVSHVALRTLNGNNVSREFIALPGIGIDQDERKCLVVRWDILNKEIITNDIIELTGSNKFIWVGRWDNVINTGGKKVIPEKLEATIKGFFMKEHVQMRFIVGSIPDPKFENKVIVIAEGKLSDEDIRRIQKNIGDAVEKHEIPRAIYCVDHFKETPTGKVDRKATIDNAVSKGNLTV